MTITNIRGNMRLSEWNRVRVNVETFGRRKYAEGL